eukprot:CAMPEP_0118899964 /NCGR_PEP_ID=MMETSP1166-20130328/6296_1 /TAXON_ID=1104430 /ORGANISM="Chrysoreinhardia sp, Strain CCMP3193" /LENGTH=223 /DNA_ID=CAMNT_0006839097 /DNA_START=13 /DNA_END=684 /DNA_ORIENTATION=+
MTRSSLAAFVVVVASTASTAMALSLGGGGHDLRRQLGACVKTTAVAACLWVMPQSQHAAFALGPENIELSDIAFADTGKIPGDLCAGRPLKVPGEKAAEGLVPKCVSVTAKSGNPNARKGAKDAAVFGYVKTATGDSAIANNPDFRSDAGQFAMIPLVPPGDGEVAFEFVAVLPPDADLANLKFEAIKAISYPGGARMAPLTACELDSLSDECDGEQQKFISK